MEIFLRFLFCPCLRMVLELRIDASRVGGTAISRALATLPMTSKMIAILSMGYS